MTDLTDIAVDVGAEALSETDFKGGWRGFVNMVRRQGVRSRMYTSRAFGEAASIAAAPIATVVVDKTLGKEYGDLKARIARTIVEPNLEKFDQWLSHAKSIDNPEERRERHALPRDGQARAIADLIVDQFGLRFGASILGQFLTQDYFTREFGAPVSRGKNLMAIGVDRGVQLGSMVLLNTVASDQAIAAQNGLVKVLKRVGVDEEKAEEWANFTVNFSAPNLLAALVSAELLTHFAKKGRL